MDTAVRILDETGRWRARDVTYWSGRWEQLKPQVPTFTIEDFKVDGDSPPNPYLKSVVRQPTSLLERPVPVGTVSHTYSLAQHIDVAEKCFEGISSIRLNGNKLDCEIGLSALGEWMNLRIYFPAQYNHVPSDGKKIRLRLECMNSVDGSSRLVVLLGWFRLVCSNGMVIGETRTELRDIHNESLNLDKIPDLIGKAMEEVEINVKTLTSWEQEKISTEQLVKWSNRDLSDKWGVKAACRVFHICTSGYDVDLIDPFASGKPTDKPVENTIRVPGSPKKAQNLYDVSQAMSWVATSRNNTEEKLAWQSSIPNIIEKLG